MPHRLNSRDWRDIRASVRRDQAEQAKKGDHVESVAHLQSLIDKLNDAITALG